MTLDIKVEGAKLRDIYKTSKHSHTTNFLIYGGVGSGKTYSLRTARAPVLVHSFDPGGSSVLEKEIKNGRIIVDTRFEIENPANPSAFRLWDAEFHRLLRIGFFEHLGTYAIDSITTWGQAALNEIL